MTNENKKNLSTGHIVINNSGSLAFNDLKPNMIIDLKRIYTVFNVDKYKIRGFHAHKNLKQILFCPYGQIEIMLDDGINKNYFLLDSPEKILFVDKGIWREMKWLKKNSVLCVAASEKYDENDYIRNYDEFVMMVKNGYWEGQNED